MTLNSTLMFSGKVSSLEVLWALLGTALH